MKDVLRAKKLSLIRRKVTTFQTELNLACPIFLCFCTINVATLKSKLLRRVVFDFANSF